MAKASLPLPNGATVEIEGSIHEVKELLEFYGGRAGKESGAPKKRASKKGTKAAEPAAPEAKGVDITEVVNLVKSCDEAEDIEARILDKSTQVARVLLPLYMVHEYLENAHALSSGDVAAITTQLSVPVAQPNASRTLSGTASKYVIGDTSRKKGAAVRYKLNRRGVKHLQSVIAGDAGSVSNEATGHSTRKKIPKKAVEKTGPKKKPAKPKAAKKRASRSSTKGSKTRRPAPGEMLRELVAGGFFPKSRTINAIQEHAQHNLAHTYGVNELSTPLRRDIHNNLLVRTKNSDGQYEYAGS